MNKRGIGLSIISIILVITLSGCKVTVKNLNCDQTTEEIRVDLVKEYLSDSKERLDKIEESIEEIAAIIDDYGNSIELEQKIRESLSRTRLAITIGFMVDNPDEINELNNLFKDTLKNYSAAVVSLHDWTYTSEEVYLNNWEIYLSNARKLSEEYAVEVKGWLHLNTK